MEILLSFLSLLYQPIKDIWGYLRNKKISNDPVEILDIREKWKVEFGSYIDKYGGEDSRIEVIIHDISRIDEYIGYEVEDGRISSWFKVELKRIYYRGIEVFLKLESIKFLDDHGWVFSSSDDEDAIVVVLVGRIRFEDIQRVDWDGDEYYNFPHIYCDFSINGAPYEELFYYQEVEGITGSFYREIGNYEDVKNTSEMLHIKRQY